MEVHGAAQGGGFMFVSFVESFEHFGAADFRWFGGRHFQSLWLCVFDFCLDDE